MNRPQLIPLLWVVAVIIAVMPFTATADEHFKYEVIATNGTAGIDNPVKGGPSINDAGDVAFIADYGGAETPNFDHGLLVGTSASDLTDLISPRDPSLGYSDEVQITDSAPGKILARRTVGLGQLVVFDAFTHNENVVFTAPASDIGPESITITEVNNESIDTAGRVVFSGAQWGSNSNACCDSYVVAPGSVGNFYTYGPAAFAHPVALDDGRVLTRTGISPPTPILFPNYFTPHIGEFRIFPANLDITESELIASTTNGTFTGLGMIARASTDGRLVVFMGELDEDGAMNVTALNQSVAYPEGPGPVAAAWEVPHGSGVFLSVATAGGRLIKRIAVLESAPSPYWQELVYDPGDTEQVNPLSGTPTDLSVNNTLEDLRSASVTYVATDAGGNVGLYATRVSFFGVGCTLEVDSERIRFIRACPFDVDRPGRLSVTPPMRIVGIGDALELSETSPPLPGTVEGFRAADMLNSRDRGDIVFWAEMSTGNEAIVRARPQEVVYVDLDPPPQIEDACFQNALSLTYGQPGFQPLPMFEGAMESVFLQIAPARADLNNPTAYDTIRQSTLSKVQHLFDELDSSGTASVNVKILPGPAPALPAGPHTTVYVGDGPLAMGDTCGGNNHPCRGLVGAAYTDLYNRNHCGPQETVVGLYNDAAFVMVDHIFDEDRALFTDESMPSPTVVTLAEESVNPISIDQISNALANVIAHEIAHTIGATHIDRRRQDLLMVPEVAGAGSQLQPPPLAGESAEIASVDTLRYLNRFGNEDVLLHDWRIPATGIFHISSVEENSGARLAFGAGSDLEQFALHRDPPPQFVINENIEVSLLLSYSGQDIIVQDAYLAAAPREPEALPSFLHVGSGSITQLLSKEAILRMLDDYVFAASTTIGELDIVAIPRDSDIDVDSLDPRSLAHILLDPGMRGRFATDHGELIQSPFDVYDIGGASPLLLGTISASFEGDVLVPSLVASAEADAVQRILGANLQVGFVTNEYSSVIPIGHIVSQSPEAYSLVSLGNSVDYVVSLGPNYVTVPDVVGLDATTAQSQLIAAGLSIGSVTDQPTKLHLNDTVFSQSLAAGEQVVEGTEIDLLVAEAPVYTVPDVVGMSQLDAQLALGLAGFELACYCPVVASSIPVGSIVSTDPGAGTLVQFQTTPQYNWVDATISGGTNPITEYPFVVEESLEDALDALSAAGMTVGAIVEVTNQVHPAGTVLFDRPTGPGSSVLNLVVVSEASSTLLVPDVVGMHEDDANGVLESIAGGEVEEFDVRAWYFVPSTTVPRDHVVAQSVAPGTAVLSTTEPIDLYISTGSSDPFGMPNLIGYNLSVARGINHALGFNEASVVSEPSTVHPQGDVIAHSPIGGEEVTSGDFVYLTVSSGPPVETVVPDVSGLSQAEATSTVEAANLVVGVTSFESSDTVAADDVISQNPIAGTVSLEWSAVDLVVSSGPEGLSPAVSSVISYIILD